jgi:hypothetical protein
MPERLQGPCQFRKVAEIRAFISRQAISAISEYEVLGFFTTFADRALG